MGKEDKQRKQKGAAFLMPPQLPFPVPFQVPATFTPSNPIKHPFVFIENPPFLHKVVQIDFHYWQAKGQIIISLHHIIQCLGVKGIFALL